MTPDIKLEKFQGPLDLLLQLIELEKLNITEVSLSQITEQFLKFLDKMSAKGGSAYGGEDNNAEELADFLVIATKLVYLKSRTLLPYLYPEEDEGPSLADQLKMYQQYILASKKINILWSQNRIAYGRVEPPVKNTEFVLPLNAHSEDLLKSMQKLVSRLRSINPLPKITIDRAVSIKQKVESIWNALKQHKKINFRDLLASAENKTEIIVSFLALLELMRDQKAFINQDSAFGNMEVNLI
ncbi:MAG: segregation/condensation protein A [Candidatus Magasanikbacteria bacterium]